MSKFRHVKVGDTVLRILAEMIPMRMVVLEVKDDLMYVYPERYSTDPWPLDECYRFDRDTGAEIDEELGWSKTQTGSVLIDENAS